MKTTMRLFLLLCTVFMASQPVLAQNDEDTRNKVVIITDDGDRQLITDEISVIRFDGPKVTVVQPWGETVFDRTLRSLTFLRPLPGTLRLTVNLSKDNDASATRGHGIDDDGFLTSTWSSTDRIYVYANATTTTPIGTLEPVTYGTTVSAMTGDITADELSSGQTIYLSTQPRPHSYAAQSGEIGSSSLFYLTAEPTITITGANASVSDATFEMAQAVVRFSLLKNTNGKALNVYGLTIEGGSETITVTPNQSNPPAQVYVGMPENSTSTTYHLTGVDDDDREWTGTVTAAIWAGKYYRANVTMTRTKLTPTVTAPTAKSLTYNGSARALVNAGSTTGGTLYYKSTTTNTAPAIDATGWSTSIPTGTTATTYYVWTKVIGNEDYNDVGVSATPVVVTIGKKALTITANAQTIAYGTSIATGTAQVTPSGLVAGDGLTSITLTPSGSSVTTNGTITPSAAKTTKGIGNYSVTYTAGNLTITAVPASVSTAPAAVGDELTYSGSAQTLFSVGTATGGTMMYKVTTDNTMPASTADFNTTIEEGTNAGTYYLWYYVAGDTNHDDTEISATNISKTIGKKAPAASDFNYTAPTSLVYDGNAKSASVAVREGITGMGTVSVHHYMEGGIVESPTGVGTYNVKITVDEGDNYSTASSELTDDSWTFTIGNATMTGITATAYSAAYDGNAHGITLNNVPDGATVTYGTTEGTYDLTVAPTYTDVAAERTVYYKVSKTNYADFTGSSTVTITQAPNAFTTQPSIMGWTYGESANAPTGGVASFGTGTITYKYCATEDGEYGTYDAIVNGQAGTWYMKGFVEATTNYAAATSEAVSFTISAAAMEGITATAYSAAYDGNAHGITLNNVPDGATVTYGETEGTYDLTVAPTYTDVAVERTVYYKVSKTNYADFTGSSTVTITQKPVTITANAQTVDYGTSITQETNQVTIGSLCNGHSLTSITLTQSTTDATTSGTITPSVATIKDSSNNDVTSNYNITYSPGSLTINKVPATLTCSTDALSFTALQGANSTVTKTGVSCTGGTISVSSGTEANCTVSYSEGTITVRRVNTAAFTDTEITVSVTPDANHTAPSSVTFSVSAVAALPAGELPGKFTINAGGGQVSFSQGNLQYQASTSTWRFATNQYDAIGSGNSNVSPTYSGWIDSFGWGSGNQPTQTSENPSEYSTFVDWGTHAISNGGNTANLWRTLTESEWTYLISTRPNASSKRGRATVNGMYCYVLLPDEWVLPSGLSFTPDANNWTNVYTTEQWAQMEAAGAVCFPAAGTRAGGTNNTNINNYNEWCCYWSSTSANSSQGYNLWITSNHVGTTDIGNYQMGASVRLVYDAPLLGTGTEEDPYMIYSVADWNILSDKVNAGNTFSGKFICLCADIGTAQSPITRMIGIHSDTESNCRPFSGTFDGQGHTLTIDYSSNDYETRSAPFSRVSGATIRNLIVAGNCGSAGRAAGIVGECNSLTTVINCISSVTVSGGPFIGGISIGGYYHIEGCLFNGTINATGSGGGLVGYGEPVTQITNCLFAPQDGSSISGGTFYHTGSGGATVTNCYYQTLLGDAQGKQARSITAGTDVTINNLGDGTEYNVSGITAYTHGIKYNGVYYAGNGEAVSLSLSHGAAPSGYTFGQYTVTGGGSLDNPTSNSPTLTMTDADQTIGAEWIPEGAITFNYIGAVQTFTAMATGYYTLQCYGAQGGYNSSGLGGKGGLSQLTYPLTKGDVLYIYVGGQGECIDGGSSHPEGGDGGWNGGGKGGTGVAWDGGNGAPYNGGGGGGGATHIATSAIGPITKSTDFTNNHTGLLLIAGGGGGGLSWGPSAGGAGGGDTGGNGHRGNDEWNIAWNNGTLSCGRDGMTSSTGGGSCEGCGGGGGGYQGGNTWTVTYNASNQSYSGAGGSSWGETTNGKGYSTTAGGATDGGNGKAVITWYGTTYPTE